MNRQTNRQTVLWHTLSATRLCRRASDSGIGRHEALKSRLAQHHHACVDTQSTVPGSVPLGIARIGARRVWFSPRLQKPHRPGQGWISIPIWLRTTAELPKRSLPMASAMARSLRLRQKRQDRPASPRNPADPLLGTVQYLKQSSVNLHIISIESPLCRRIVDR